MACGSWGHALAVGIQGIGSIGLAVKSCCYFVHLVDKLLYNFD